MSEYNTGDLLHVGTLLLHKEYFINIIKTHNILYGGKKVLI